MTRESITISELLAAGRTDAARELLCGQLKEGAIPRPKARRHVGSYRGQHRAHRQPSGRHQSGCTPVGRPRDFFVDELEPEWGHLHKGHIYFRLGLASANIDLRRARTELELAAMDDGERSAFMGGLFGPSFDTAIRGEVVMPELVDGAIKAIVPPEGMSGCRTITEELRVVRTLNLPFATVSLTGALLESILLSILFHGGRTSHVAGKDVRSVELGTLLRGQQTPTVCFRTSSYVRRAN